MFVAFITKFAFPIVTNIYSCEYNFFNTSFGNFLGIFDDIFNKAANHVELANVKTSDMGSLFKIKYIIQLNGQMTEKELIDALRTRNGNLEIAISRYITKENEL